MPEIDTSRAHPARMYDYLLGGKDHFEADREAIGALLNLAAEEAKHGPSRRACHLARSRSGDNSPHGGNHGPSLKHHVSNP